MWLTVLSFLAPDVMTPTWGRSMLTSVISYCRVAPACWPGRIRDRKLLDIHPIQFINGIEHRKGMLLLYCDPIPKSSRITFYRFRNSTLYTFKTVILSYNQKQHFQGHLIVKMWIFCAKKWCVDEYIKIPEGIPNCLAPLSPYARLGGTVKRLFSSGHIPRRPFSQPLITSPAPNWNRSGRSLS